jgi:hypothetical protein
MGLIAVNGAILGLLAANPGDQDFMEFFLIASPVRVVLPVHLTTEGSRRNARNAGFHRGATRIRKVLPVPSNF